ncbi:DUF7848 domain-containing protein [Streptomyces sp. NPDC002596]
MPGGCGRGPGRRPRREGRGVTPGRVFRYVEYLTCQDPTGELSWAVECVSGDESDCGASSGPMTGETPAIRWMSNHTASTGHNRYRRTFTDYALTEPKS